MTESGSGNRLAEARSAYLRSAAHQPVDWWPFSAEAFERAKAEDKPVLLDSGAVWCHWCHVMDRESYEDPETAALINRLYVPVKVDRDERPDVDARYQRAVQAVTGEGGWPLTAFLTPDGEVFFGGTYFPPEDRHGRPGFRRVLERVAELYRTDRSKATESAARIGEALIRMRDGAEPGELRPRMIDEVVDGMAAHFDFRYGGFGHAPKFPHPSAIDLALGYYCDKPLDWVREIVEKTLAGMGKGGIYDQVGGGFHRYSTDARWIVPHFEKMIYDNSELLRNYARAFAVFGDPFYREIAEGIVDWVLEVMTDPEGGFYASQDADVGPEDDGAYWTWTEEEAREAIGDDGEFAIAQRAFDLYAHGEMPTDPRRNVLWVAREPAALAAEFDRTPDEARRILASAKAKMKAARDRRPTPFVDRTLYTSWNAMMAGALLDAARYLGRADAGAAALRALERVWAEAYEEGHGVVHRVGDPESPRLLEDQVQTAAAWLDAFEATQEPAALERAERCVEATLRFFWDDGGGLFDVPADGERTGYLRERLKPVDDTPTPSANGVAALALARLHALTGKEEYRRRAEATLRAFAGSAARQSFFAATYFRALDHVLNPAAHAAVAGEADDPAAAALLEAARGVYRPRLVVQRVGGGGAGPAAVPEVVAAMLERGGGPRGYFCAGRACAEPASDPQVYRETVSRFGRHERAG